LLDLNVEKDKYLVIHYELKSGTSWCIYVHLLVVISCTVIQCTISIIENSPLEILFNERSKFMNDSTYHVQIGQVMTDGF